MTSVRENKKLISTQNAQTKPKQKKNDAGSFNSNCAETKTSAKHSAVSANARVSKIRRAKIHREQLPKTKLRGWIHLTTTPLALANSIVLLCFTTTGGQAFSVVLYLIAGLVLFGCSATYHIGNWNPRTKSILRRLDHANIFLLIAGTYTPTSAILLSPSQTILVLSIIWGGSIIGILMHVFWINSPRWLYVILYVLLGWVAVWFLPEFWVNGSPAVVVLLLCGGGAYTIGAMFYAFRWPNPWPKYFGFHEFFHLGTVAGYACHAVAIWLALFIVS